VLAVSGMATLLVPTAVVDAYDPLTGLWNQTAPLATGRFWFQIALLPFGRTLVAGGLNTNGGFAVRMACLIHY
jgi:hypothetical protein